MSPSITAELQGILPIGTDISHPKDYATLRSFRMPRSGTRTDATTTIHEGVTRNLQASIRYPPCTRRKAEHDKAVVVGRVPGTAYEPVVDKYPPSMVDVDQASHIAERARQPPRVPFASTPSAGHQHSSSRSCRTAAKYSSSGTGPCRCSLQSGSKFLATMARKHGLVFGHGYGGAGGGQLEQRTRRPSPLERPCPSRTHLGHYARSCAGADNRGEQARVFEASKPSGTRRVEQKRVCRVPNQQDSRLPRHMTNVAGAAVSLVGLSEDAQRQHKFEGKQRRFNADAEEGRGRGGGREERSALLGTPEVVT
ncbi:hypothetical protein C8T65DRAFT_697893 [Cerioporus squamosus]|nr:hypothetical protein C8T65DRAFT_697892 [Cerioporus squamosus]KAI0698303.1 hypothetical protein C8T65DRAFT_697893 [Cerioporus squamosus]